VDAIGPESTILRPATKPTRQVKKSSRIGPSGGDLALNAMELIHTGRLMLALNRT